MSESTGGPTANTAIRGIVLVAVAAILGVILLNSGLDNEFSASAGAGDDGAAAATTTTTSTVALRPPSSLVVLVANGTRTAGAASAYTDALGNLGYSTLEPVTANSTFEGSIVYFAPGFRAEAERMAIEVGVPAVSVQPLPVTPPVEDLASANILLVIGPELASVEPGEATPAGSASEAGSTGADATDGDGDPADEDSSNGE